MRFAFESGGNVFIKAPRNSKLGAVYYGPWLFVRYITRSHALAEVRRNDGYMDEGSVSYLRPYRPMVSQRMIRYLCHYLGQKAKGFLDSYIITDSLSSGVGERYIPVSDPANIEQCVGIAVTLHRPIEISNKRQREMHLIGMH